VTGVARRGDSVDAVIVGVGWAGGIIASELTKAGLSVVGLERGPLRAPNDSAYVDKHDELRFAVRQDLVQDTALETWTFRHHDRERALPIRYAGAFTPATGVGGSSGHYGALTSRMAPWEFEIRSRTIARYGESAIAEGSTIQDWGITYEELEPYYDRMERQIGVSGAAGNVSCELREGGNPFEGPRSRPFPLPPVKLGEGATMIAAACRSLGLHPHPMASAILTRDYTNPDGVARGACTYCGNCSFYLCAAHAKGDALEAVLPVALASGRFDLRPSSYVVRVLHDGGRATGVLYHDAAGQLVEQPAELVVLSAYAFNNTRLLLLSGMGEPYDPISATGVVGRNYAHQVHVLATGFFRNRRFRSYMGSGGGIMVDDYANDNFDHGELGFIGGGALLCSPSLAAIRSPLPPGTPTWGAEFKRAMRDWYDRSVTLVGVGHSLSYRANRLDLDPTYKDAWGHPLIRITFDWNDNERRIAGFLGDRAREILTASASESSAISVPSEHFDVVRYQSTHNTGGAIMGSDPRTSVVNSHMQMWDYENVWVVGGSAFPQNGTPGPTGTIGALAYRAAEAILAQQGSQRGQ
jgi:gluconate 2-dehydrogenase alpha chain